MSETTTVPEMMATAFWNLFTRVPHDMISHMHTLRELSAKVDRCCELGVRYGMSSIAMIAGKPTSLASWDIQAYGMEPWVAAYAETMGVDWSHAIGDSRAIEIEPCDLLFIDTEHTYQQLTDELERHHKQVSRYIVLHDTETYAYGPDGSKG